MTTPTPPAANDIEVTDTPYQAPKNSATNNMSGEIRLSKGQWATVCKIMQAKFEDLPEILDGASFKRLRLKSGLTQQALAEELKVAISTIRQWERGVGDEVGGETEPAPAKPLTLRELIERQGLNIGEFAQAVEAAWAPISKRPLSRDAVSAWINGRVKPRMQPEELREILEILNCSLEEFISSLRD